MEACEAPASYVPDATDCDDAQALSFPGNPELCDGLDNNCDGVVDEGVKSTFYADTDGDAFGDPAASLEACEAPASYVPDATDCDDGEALSFPGNAELCDGLDNNCDGAVDEGVKSIFYADTDGDAFGAAAASLEACEAPASYVPDATDCDDGEALSFPGNAELCDGLDNNCDGAVDEGVKSTFYADTDADTYGDPASAVLSCNAPNGFIVDKTDCDDKDATISPVGVDLPLDGVDQDCSGADYAPTVYGVDRTSGNIWALDLLNDGVVWTANDARSHIDVARGPDGTLYVTDLDAGAITTVSADGQTKGTLVASGLDGAHGIVYDYARDELVVAGSSGNVWTVNPQTGAVTHMFAYDGEVIGAYRFAGSDDIWFTDRAASRVLLWHADTGAVDMVAGVSANAANLLVPNARGNLVTSGATQGDIWEIDTRDLSATRLGTTGLGTYGLCASPFAPDEYIVGDHLSRYRLWSVADGLQDLAPTPIGVTWGCDTDLPADADHDGYTSALRGGTDCDDWSADVNAGMADDVGDGADQNCDRVDGVDADGDGDASVASGGHDCDDSDPSVFWGSSATCGGATSCAELLSANPLLSSGVYSLDLDGAGPGGAVDTRCVMADGGWTLALVVNSVHNAPIFSNAQSWGFGSTTDDLHANGALVAGPYAASTSTQPMAAWLDLNTASYTHFRVAGYSNGVQAYSSDPIARASLRLDFGNNGYYLYNAPADPARMDGQTYYWCGGDTAYTDGGVGQVNPPVGAPADCKGHGSLGSGWDFSRNGANTNPGANTGLTLCGSAGMSTWMYTTLAGTLYNYPSAGGAQAIWIR